MAFRGYYLTMTGVAQRLSDVYGDGIGVVVPASDIPYREITFQAKDTNGADIYVGHTSAVSATNFGFHVDYPKAGTNNPPSRLGPYNAGPLHLSDFWVLGTNGEILTIGGVPF